jgi:acetyl-CoA acetyltransferase
MAAFRRFSRGRLTISGCRSARPAGFAQLATGYRGKHGIEQDLLKRAIAHVSRKSHQNGVLSPKAHLRKAITIDQILNAPMIAEPLGLFDCCGVSDGAAAAIVTTPEIARAMGRQDMVTIKALQLAIVQVSKPARHSGTVVMCAPPVQLRSALMPKREFRIRARNSASWKCTTASRLPNW